MYDCIHLNYMIYNNIYNIYIYIYIYIIYIYNIIIIIILHQTKSNSTQSITSKVTPNIIINYEYQKGVWKKYILHALHTLKDFTDFLTVSLAF